MTVYVNKLRQHRWLMLGGRTAMPPPLHALTADGEDELHAFAERLGIRRDPGTPVTPAGFLLESVVRRYTLTQGERNRAVKLGAQPISARKARQMERQQAAANGERLP